MMNGTTYIKLELEPFTDKKDVVLKNITTENRELQL